MMGAQKCTVFGPIGEFMNLAKPPSVAALKLRSRPLVVAHCTFSVEEYVKLLPQKIFEYRIYQLKKYKNIFLFVEGCVLVENLC